MLLSELPSEQVLWTEMLPADGVEHQSEIPEIPVTIWALSPAIWLSCKRSPIGCVCGHKALYPALFSASTVVAERSFLWYGCRESRTRDLTAELPVRHDSLAPCTSTLLVPHAASCSA